MAFGNLFGQKKTEENQPSDIGFSSEQSAFINILYLCIISDNTPEDGADDFELAALVGACNNKPFLKNTFVADCINEGHSFKTLLGQRKTLELAAKYLSPENKKSAFVICLDLIYANTIVTNMEERFMAEICEVFDLEKEFLDSVHEITKLKYQ